MQFEWHYEKNKTNLAKHGFAFENACRIFEGVVVELEDKRADYGETRLWALGLLDGLLILVTYTWRKQTRRIISARRANAKERKFYDEETGNRLESRS